MNAADSSKAHGAPMEYESNPKHSDPCQPGRKGSICPREVRNLAQQLLDGSVPVGDARYACHEGRAYCAREHVAGRWHGYPIGWREVPAKLRRQWVREGRVSKQDTKRFWEGDA